MAGMVDFMVYLGEKYYRYQQLGGTCVTEDVKDGEVVALEVKLAISISVSHRIDKLIQL